MSRLRSVNECKRLIKAILQRTNFEWMTVAGHATTDKVHVRAFGCVDISFWLDGTNLKIEPITARVTTRTSRKQPESFINLANPNAIKVISRIMRSAILYSLKNGSIFEINKHRG